MFKILTLSFFLFFSFSSYSLADENLLTLKQQLDRLQREVNDLSKSVFNKSENGLGTSSNQKNQAVNFAAIDMRIYDIEQDIKNLTMTFEELTFLIDELNDNIKNLEENFNFSIDNINSKIQENIITNNKKDLSNLNQDYESQENENTLGTLKINSSDSVLESEQLEIQENLSENIIENEEKELIAPEDQFQLAFDQIRRKDYNQAKNSLNIFINQYPENQLSGSAHYWLGELHILDKNYREAALILAEGFQNYPKSIKAVDMLYKLADSLIAIEKNKEACDTLSKLLNDFPKNKLANKAQNKKIEISCQSPIE